MLQCTVLYVELQTITRRVTTMINQMQQHKRRQKIMLTQASLQTNGARPSGLLVYVHCSPAKGQRRKIPPLSPPLAIREYFTASHLYQHRRRGSRKMTPAFWPPRLGPLLTGQTTTTNRRRIRCRRRRVDRVRDSPFRFGNRGIGHRGLYSTRGFFATLN